MNLFVIGNGFDMAHGLKTSYVDFRNYLEEEDLEYLISLEKMYDCLPESRREAVEEYLWKEFEKNLAQIKEGEILDCGMYMDLGLESGDINIESTLDVFWEEQYGFIERMNEFVNSWICQIEIDTYKKTNKITSDRNDLFLTFNYTLVLEKIYGVDPLDILHIHGSINRWFDSDPIMGHGEGCKLEDMRIRADEAGERFYEKEASICNALANYYERTFKDVEFYISQNNYFFTKMISVDNLYIVGHSFGEVDMPYFKKIKESVKKDTVWNVCYHKDSEEDDFKNKIMSIGVNEENIEMLESEKFFNV